ncbi:MAG: acyl carrier protein [Lachnospiraceae bacterium]|nr:acyl carrier protein [Lachnospiraceae bacterium]
MDEFLKFIAGIFDVDASALSPETAYGTVQQWDSLMHIRLVGEIEEEYGVEIPIDEVAEIRTLADFYRYIGV